MRCEQLSTVVLLLFSQAKVALLQNSDGPPSFLSTASPEIDHRGSTTTNEAGVPCVLGPPVNTTLLAADFTNLNISWLPPEGADSAGCSANPVLQFTVFYYKKRSRAASSKSIDTGPNVTAVLLKGLVPGAVYCYYVQANYSIGSPLNGNKQCEKTRGYGPDNPCGCSRLGTREGTVKTCEPKSGQCECKNKFYTGRICDECVSLAYQHLKTGCQPCQCDSERSTGTCFVSQKGIVMCDCYGNYGGTTCVACKNGFHDHQGLCVPCNCSDNADTTSDHICESRTGKCLACAYNTTGDRCERCLPNYVGDPTNRTCHKPVDTHHLPTDRSRSVHLTAGSIIGITLAIVCAAAVALAIVFYQHCRSCRRKPLNLWTVELKDDHENVSFSGMLEQPEFQSVDAALLEENGSRSIYLGSASPGRAHSSRSPPAERPSTLSLSAPYRALRT